MTNNDIFPTTSSFGATKTFHLHSSQSLIAYGAGCQVLLWNLNTNEKVLIHSHESPVICIQFVGSNQEFILSIDSQSRPTLLLTHWSTLRKVQQVSIPSEERESPIQGFSCAYNAPNFLILAEKYRNQYTFTLWDFRTESLSLIATQSEDVMSQCVNVNIFDPIKGNFALFFAMVEKRSIKYWGYNKEKLELVHKIHVKDNILDSVISPLTQFFLFVTDAGKLCIINKEGELVSSVIHPVLSYSCLSLHNDYLFLGTVQGIVEIYHLSSLKFAKALKNLRQSPNKASSQNHNTQVNSFYAQTGIINENQGVLEPSRKLMKLKISHSKNLLVLVYEDDQVYFYDFQKGKQEGSITGHSEKIKQIVWSQSTEQTMITCSNDGTIRIWSSLADKWTSSLINPPATFAFSILNEKARKIGNRTKKGDMSFRSRKDCEYKVSCLQVLWSQNEIYAGDNRGYLCIYDIQKGTLKYEIPIGESKIKSITLRENGDYIGVVLANGSCFLTERQDNFRTRVILEPELVESEEDFAFFRGVKFVEIEDSVASKPSEKLSQANFFTSQSHSSNSKSLPVMKNSLALYQTPDKLRKSRFVELRVITTHSPNTLLMHQIVSNQGILNSLVIANYTIEGQIMDFDIHVSKQYLLVLGSGGFVYVFKLKSGQLQNIIEVPKTSSKMALDPSGLYIAIASNYNKQEASTYKEDDSKKSFQQYERSNKSSKTPQKEFESNKNTGQSVVSLYEIWTGEFVGEKRKIPAVSCLSFSRKGSYLTVGGIGGIVTVLSINKQVEANIQGVLDDMRADPLFWSRFHFGGEEDEYFLSPQIMADFDTLRSQNVEKRSFIQQNMHSAEKKSFIQEQPQLTRNKEPLQVVSSLSNHTSGPSSLRYVNQEVQVSAKNPHSAGSLYRSPRIPNSERQEDITSSRRKNDISIQISDGLKREYNSNLPSGQFLTPTKSVRFEDLIKSPPEPSQRSALKPSQTLPKILIEDRSDNSYRNRGLQNQGTQVSQSFTHIPRILSHQDVAQQTSDFERSFRSGGKQLSSASFQNLSSANQTIFRTSQQQMRIIQPDPADIDDNIITPKIKSRLNENPTKKSEETFRVKDVPIRGEYYGNIQQKEDQYIINQKLMKEHQQFMIGKNLEESIEVNNSERDSSEMYNDISEFEKRFLREPSHRGKKY